MYNQNIEQTLIDSDYNSSDDEFDADKVRESNRDFLANCAFNDS